MDLFRQKKPYKVMKSAISSHSMEVITLVFFAHRNKVLGGIFKRMCLDSLNLYNEHKNSLFPLTESNCFLDILTIFQVLSIDKWCFYNDKNRGRYLREGKNIGDCDVSPFVSNNSVSGQKRPRSDWCLYITCINLCREYKSTSRKHTYIILTPLNPAFTQ